MICARSIALLHAARYSPITPLTHILVSLRTRVSTCTQSLHALVRTAVATPPPGLTFVLRLSTWARLCTHLEQGQCASSSEHRVMNDDAPFTALLVHWSRPAEAALPKFLQLHLPVVEEVRRYKSVFRPGRMVGGETGPRTGRAWRGRSHIAARAARDDARERCGRGGVQAAMARPRVQQPGKPGVVRCDLLEEVAEEGQQGSADGVDADAAAATTSLRARCFATRRLKRLTRRLAHEEGARTAPMLQGKDGDVDVKMLDTILPRTSPYPFRSRWASVGA